MKETNIILIRKTIDFFVKRSKRVDLKQHLGDDYTQKLDKVLPKVIESIEIYKGIEDVLGCIANIISKTKFSVIIITPIIIPELLKVISDLSFTIKNARFFITYYNDTDDYNHIIKLMSKLGNINFRQLNQSLEYFAVLKDGEEIFLAPVSISLEEIIGIKSKDQEFIRFFQYVSWESASKSRPIETLNI